MNLRTALAAFEQRHGRKPNADELLEIEERIALIQEGCRKPIEVVRRNPQTGELSEDETTQRKRGEG